MMDDNCARLSKFGAYIYLHSNKLPTFLRLRDIFLNETRLFCICTTADSYEMVKALYDFKATFAKTLSFREGEYFILLQRNIKQKNWWQVVNRGGHLGYIPSNYVTSVTVCIEFVGKIQMHRIANLLLIVHIDDRLPGAVSVHD